MATLTWIKLVGMKKFTISFAHKCIKKITCWRKGFYSEDALHLGHVVGNLGPLFFLGSNDAVAGTVV
jgi:hypothetical protein